MGDLRPGEARYTNDYPIRSTDRHFRDYNARNEERTWASNRGGGLYERGGPSPGGDERWERRAPPRGSAPYGREPRGPSSPQGQGSGWRMPGPAPEPRASATHQPPRAGRYSTTEEREESEDRRIYEDREDRGGGGGGGGYREDRGGGYREDRGGGYRGDRSRRYREDRGRGYREDHGGYGDSHESERGFGRGGARGSRLDRREIVDPNRRSGPRGMSPLHHAVQAGREAEVTRLLGMAADVELGTLENNWTPLHYAAAILDEETAVTIATLLLDAGANPKTTSVEGTTPLHVANTVGIAQLLVARGAEIHATNDKGTTPLHRASYRSKPDVVECLLQLGADPTVRDAENKTPFAVANGVKKWGCLSYGASPEDHERVLALLKAAYRAREEAHEAKITVVAYGSREDRDLPYSALRHALEEAGFVVTQEYLRERQPFGYLQFADEATVDNVLDECPTIDLGERGVITFQRCRKLMPGRDPRLSVKDSPFRGPDLSLRNIPFRLPLDGLRAKLEELEVKPTEIKYTYNKTDGTFKGSALVSYASVEDAVAVFDLLEAIQLDGRRLLVEYKRPEVPRKERERFVPPPSQADLDFNWRSKTTTSAVVVVKQGRGPDGSRGFSEKYRRRRMQSLGLTLADVGLEEEKEENIEGEEEEEEEGEEEANY
eukprot:TRINITY_DN32310_c0_g1_i1.p1 TRINITY_DN32310_c0_g1~~TRINITY_DN32310_c0_g1_i1.p1  ORF type:complete len:703 (-),score=145.33 TRINITY_DN32310_c0_g1_i1:235-2223(-)